MKLQLSRLDALLLLMAIIWGSNYSIIKAAFHEIPPVAFNVLRMLLASSIFLIALTGPYPFSAGRDRKRGTAPLTRRDWLDIVLLAIVGQFLYQILFMAALSRTSASNGGLILGCTPIFVVLLTAALGAERIGPIRWAGVALSAFGIYLVVGHSASLDRATLPGDLLMVAAVLCWSVATVGSRRVLARHSPLIVTGYSMAIGSALYAPLGWTALRGLAWREVSAGAWLAMVFSAVFALFIAYMIWYTAVQRLGNTRTSVYSNMVPIVAMVVARVWLGEQIGPLKIAGAAAIILGVALTKIQFETRPVARPA